jgi:hypothetical protein
LVPGQPRLDTSFQPVQGKTWCLPQNISFAPNWIFRLPVALVMLPTDEVPNVTDGLLPGGTPVTESFGPGSTVGMVVASEMGPHRFMGSSETLRVPVISETVAPSVLICGRRGLHRDRFHHVADLQRHVYAHHLVDIHLDPGDLGYLKPGLPDFDFVVSHRDELDIVVARFASRCVINIVRAGIGSGDLGTGHGLTAGIRDGSHQRSCGCDLSLAIKGECREPTNDRNTLFSWFPLFEA